MVKCYSRIIGFVAMFLLLAGVVLAAAPVMNTTTILPATVYTDNNLQILCNATDADGGNISYEYKWYINDIESNISYPTDPDLCYQETTNVSTACGGLDTGEYHIGSDFPEIVGMEYKKPNFAVGATWEVKYSNGPSYRENITLSDAQYNLLPTSLMMFSRPSGGGGSSSSRGYITNTTVNESEIWASDATELLFDTGVFDGCNGAGASGYINNAMDGNWDTRVLYYNSGGIWTYTCVSNIKGLFYEEGMHWQLRQTYNESIDINVGNISSSYTSPGDNLTVACRAFDGITYSSWLNSTAASIFYKPAVQLVNITPVTIYTNTTNMLGWCNITSEQDYSINYSWQWNKGGVHFINGTTTNYTSGSLINVYNITADNTTSREVWNLSCRGYDGNKFGSWSSTTKTISSYTPIMQSVSILPVGLYYDTSDIPGWGNATDYESDNLSYSYKWYNQSVLQSSYIASSWCYQESTQTEDQQGTDGYCNLNYGGNYSTSGGHIYFNYKKPPHATNNSLWQVKQATLDTYNISIPQSCWSADSDTISFSMLATVPTIDLQPRCYNGSTWVSIGSYTSGTGGSPQAINYLSKIYDGLWDTHGYYNNGLSMWVRDLTSSDSRLIWEEAMWWDVDLPYLSGINTNINNLSSSATTAGENWTFSARAYDGLDYSSWMNLTSIIIRDLPDVNIIPSPALATENLTCNWTKTDGVPITTSYYAWFENGTAMGITTEILNATNTSEGNSYNCTVILNDGTYNYTETVSNLLLVGDFEDPVYVSSRLAATSIVTNNAGNIYANFTDNSGNIGAATVEIHGISGNALALDYFNRSMVLSEGDEWRGSYIFTITGTYNFKFFFNDPSSNSNTETVTDLILTVKEPSSPQGGGGGSKVVTLPSLNLTGYCGDNICQDGENPTACWTDCKINLDTLVTCLYDDDLACNWDQGWFPAVLLIFLVGVASVSIFIVEKRSKK